MTRLAILSIFRNAAHGQVQRFMKQSAALADMWKMPVRVIAVYGDCTDNTADMLVRHASMQHLSLELVHCSHGGPVFGSVESSVRFTALSKVGNAGLDSVKEYDDVVWYVESDLLWNPSVARDCLQMLDGGNIDMVAPLVFAGQNFYDVFAFRAMDGTRFAPFFPYHSTLLHDGRLTPVSSVGSAFAMTKEVAMSCRMGEQGVLVGLCTDAISKGYRIWVDASRKVMHPA